MIAFSLLLFSSSLHFFFRLLNNLHLDPQVFLLLFFLFLFLGSTVGWKGSDQVVVLCYWLPGLAHNTVGRKTRIFSSQQLLLFPEQT